MPERIPAQRPPGGSAPLDVSSVAPAGAGGGVISCLSVIAPVGAVVVLPVMLGLVVSGAWREPGGVGLVGACLALGCSGRYSYQRIRCM